MGMRNMTCSMATAAEERAAVSIRMIGGPHLSSTCNVSRWPAFSDALRDYISKLQRPTASKQHSIIKNQRNKGQGRLGRTATVEASRRPMTNWWLRQLSGEMCGLTGKSSRFPKSHENACKAVIHLQLGRCGITKGGSCVEATGCPCSLSPFSENETHVASAVVHRCFEKGEALGRHRWRLDSADPWPRRHSRCVLFQINPLSSLGCSAAWPRSEPAELQRQKMQASVPPSRKATAQHVRTLHDSQACLPPKAT